MPEKKAAFEFERYLAIIRERRYIVLAVGLTVMSLSVMGSFLLPRTYKASSTVFVQRGLLAQPFVKNSGLGATLNDELMMLTNYIKSRDLLKHVIGELNMDVMAKNPRQYEALIAKVRKNLRVSVQSGDSGIDLFSISYVSANPKEARDFVNALVNEYIEETIADRRNAAFGAYDFLKKQIEDYAKKLDDAGQQLAQFQQSHPNMAVSTNYTRATALSDLQSRQVDSEIRLMQLLDKRKGLAAELSGKAATATVQGAQGGPLQARLSKLNETLAILKTKYTDQYPEVVNLEAEIGSLKKQMQSAGVRGAPSNALRQRLEEKLSRTNSSISQTKARLAEISQLSRGASHSLNGLPAEQSELATLQNNKDVDQRIYDSLIGQLESANVSKNFQTSDYSSMLRVVDPAVMPYVPYKPDRVKIILMGLLLGAAAGAGSAIGLDYLHDAYRDEETLEKDLKIPVLASIPLIYAEEEDRRSRRKDIRIFGAAAVYVLVILALLVNEAMFRYLGKRFLPF